MAYMTQILELLFGGFTETAKQMGLGLSQFVEGIFLNTEAGTLTTFGMLAVIFAGMALALSLCKFILIWITSFGKSK
mgnify:CR=1 FL=1